MLNGVVFESSDKLSKIYHLRSQYSAPKGWILHFHGNGGRACDRLGIAHELLELGYHVVLAEYPGYADDTPLPSTEKILRSSEQAFDYVQTHNPDKLPVILFGESLGTGPATYLASKNLENVKALILQTPFTSLGDVGQAHYFYLPVKLLIRDDFKAYEWARHVLIPVFVFHGNKDEVIPFNIGKEQVANFKDHLVTFKIIEGAHHNDLLEYSGKDIWKQIDQFIENNKGVKRKNGFKRRVTFSLSSFSSMSSIKKDQS